MKNGNTVIKRILCIIILISSVFLNCSFDFIGSDVKVEMDPEARPSYQYIKLDDLIDAANENRVRVNYPNKYYWMYAVVSGVDLGEKTVTLSPAADERKSLKFKNENKTKGLSIAKGNSVLVYFQIKTATGVKYEIDSIERSSVKQDLDGAYSSINGRYLKPEEANKRMIGDGKVCYYIPDSWKGVEADIRENELGSIEGYQYKLNQIGKGSAYSECLFVTYFDKARFVDINERKNNNLIEKAIVKDILKKDIVSKFPLKEIRTPYGQDYKYYRATFNRSTGETYSTEFVFQEANDGLIVFLYVYKDKDHLEDIMNVMRTTKRI